MSSTPSVSRRPSATRANSRMVNGRGGVVESPVPGASNAIVRRGPSAVRNGAHISMFAPSPLTSSNGRPTVPSSE